MDSTLRTAAKAATWQVSGLIVMTLVGYLFTGSLLQGGGVAVTGTLIGTASFFLHERVWNSISWGRVKPAAGAGSAV